MPIHDINFLPTHRSRCSAAIAIAIIYIQLETRYAPGIQRLIFAPAPDRGQTKCPSSFCEIKITMIRDGGGGQALERTVGGRHR